MIKKTSVIIITLLLTMVIVGTIWGGDMDDKVNKYNVVFVTDASGSMRDTDPQGYRYEAIDLFMGMMTNGGNNVGSVVFGSDVDSKKDIVEINDKKDKELVSKDIRKREPGGWTDIGGGLQAAVKMLDSKKKNGLESIVILLTDGNTELGDIKKTEKSIEKKENAIEAARDSGYQIYSICLNKDNSANTNEMKQIAAATGGKFKEVKNAQDLRNIFDMFYGMIYSTESKMIGEQNIPSSGRISMDFDIASAGVNEVNIVVYGETDKTTLIRPDGSQYSQSAMNQISTKANTFELLKIQKPEAGKWKIVVEGKKGTHIKVNKIYNQDLRVNTYIEPEKDGYVMGEKIKFVTEVYEGEEKVTDAEKLKDYIVTMEITDYEGNVIDRAGTTDVVDGDFVLPYVLNDINEYGTYYATVRVESPEIKAEGGTFTINIGNTPPKATEKVIKKHINRWPFLIKTDSTVDLSKAATDKEDSEMSYKVESSTWMEDDYTLKNNKLTIENFSVSKGSFRIQAYDSQGAYCTFDVKITSTNVGLVAMIAILAGVLLFVIISSLLLWHRNGIPFMGQIRAENIENGQSASPMKNRGRIRLAAFQLGQTGLSNKCYFQATGKDYIYFISKKPVTTDATYGKTKKVKIDSSLDIRIFADKEQTKGILVTFESYKNNSNY